MKTETRDIDAEQLLRCVAIRYGFDLQSIVFLPKGEDAYAYIAEDRYGTRYFVRVQPQGRTAPNDSIFEIVEALRYNGRLQTAVAPYRNLDGAFTTRYEQCTVAVFPFLEGETLYSRGASEGDLVAAAAILATLHDATLDPKTSKLPKEVFDNPFRDPLLAALRMVDSNAEPQDDVQRKLRDLLLEQRADLLGALDHYAEMASSASAATTEWVITHGDPNLDNFLKDNGGHLHLTDWGELALGPPERDLFAFTGAEFPAFLDPYVRARKRVQLHIDIFAFYIFRWCLQEIADYTMRILSRDLSFEVKEQAWAELQPYLPIQHEHIARGIDEVQAAIHHIIG